MSLSLKFRRGLPFLRGVNMGQFDSAGNVNALPPTQAIDYFFSNGFRSVRFPFSPTRMITSPGGPLEPTYFGRYKSISDYIGAKGMKVIADPHSRSYTIGATFTEYDPVTGGTEVIIGETPQFTAAHWGDFLGRFSAALTGDHVQFELMNEPHNQDDDKLVATLNTGIAAIRGNGKKNLIQIPFTSFSNRFAWLNERARMIALLGRIVDPLNHNAIVVHIYLDEGSQGQTANIAADHMNGIVDITLWARATARKLIGNEFGAASDPASIAAGRNVWNYMRANRDVWIGANWWRASTGQDENYPPAYIYQLMPIELGQAGVPKPGPYTDRPQMSFLKA